MEKVKPVSFSISASTIRSLDAERGDVPRSAFLRKIIQKHYDEQEWMTTPGRWRRTKKTEKNGGGAAAGRSSEKSRRQGKTPTANMEATTSQPPSSGGVKE